MSRILVIEDDRAILRGLVDNLEYESYEVLSTTDGAQGYVMIREEKPDLVILDLMLPKMSGYEICRKVRAEGDATPILMLTARGEEMDRVLGLDLGADDYVTKPFSVPELLARVRALLRRARSFQAGSLPDELSFDDVVVDFKRFEANKAGQDLKLSRKEYGVLRLLAVLGLGLIALAMRSALRPSTRLDLTLFKYASGFMLSGMLVIVIDSVV